MSGDVSKLLRRILDRLEDALRRLLGRPPKPPPGPRPIPASPVRSFIVEIDAMKNARFFWQFPTTRVNGGPLDPADIVGTEISIRVAGLPDWTVLDVAVAPELELTQNELTHGDYEARAVVLTVDPADGARPPVRGAERVLAFSVLDDSPAAAVEGFAVELT